MAFLSAEIKGGIIFIAISSVLIKLTHPEKWLDEAREKVESEGDGLTEDFDWKKRIKSKES